MLKKKVVLPSQLFFRRKSIEKVIFLLFSDKNLEKSHEKSFEKSMKLGKKIFNKDKTLVVYLKKLALQDEIDTTKI
jgi:hypothetical protein